jgi:hypothetical protein
MTIDLIPPRSITVVTEIDPESPSSLKPTGSWAKLEQRLDGYGWLGYRNVDD